MQASAETKELYAWWQKTCLLLKDAVPLKTVNRNDLRGTAITPVVLRHKVDQYHVPVDSLAPFITQINLILLLDGRKGGLS